jgi:hypothetical protein
MKLGRSLPYTLFRAVSRCTVHLMSLSLAIVEGQILKTDPLIDRTIGMM